MGWTKEQLQNHSKRDLLLKPRTPAFTPVATSPLLAVTVSVPAPSPVAGAMTLPEGRFTTLTFTVPGPPMGKPRMTRRDAWKKRPCVMRYWDYCARIRQAAGRLPPNPDGLMATVYLAMPESWSDKKKADTLGQPHRQKPDYDNIAKSLGDALFTEDCLIWRGGPIMKFWCADNERTEITVLYQCARTV